jgi:phage shock protein PspC (stress-responsive transcriptional regulator)
MMSTMSDAPPETRRITRSRDDRILGGVAAGFARYLGVDPVLVRLGFVVAAVVGGIGVLAYVAAWLLVPDDAEAQGTGRRPALRQLAGFALLGIGLLATFGQFDFWVDQQAVWALGLIAVGGAVLWARGRDRREPDGSPPPTDGPAPPAGPSPPAPAPPAPPPTVPPPITPPTTPPAAAYRAVAPGAPSWPPPTSPLAPPAPGSAVAAAAPPRAPASRLGVLALLVVLVGTGIAIALDAGGAVDVPAGVVLAGALVVIGLALVVGAWRGRARWLVIPGVALALFAAATSALDLPLAGGIGERDYRPSSFAAVDDHYELGIGSLELDLRDLDFRNRVEHVRASVGIGELKVWVPDGVRVVVDGEVSVGELVAFGDQDAGTNVDERVVRPGTEGGGTLRLELRDGIGSIQVFDADHGGPT